MPSSVPLPSASARRVALLVVAALAGACTAGSEAESPLRSAASEAPASRSAASAAPRPSVAVSTPASASSPAAARPAPPADVVVRARLVERPPGLAYCGYLHVIAVVRFEVLEVLVGDGVGGEVYAVLDCPLEVLGGASMALPARYRLSLSRSIPEGVHPTDAYPASKAPRFWAVSVVSDLLPLTP